MDLTTRMANGKIGVAEAPHLSAGANSCPIAVPTGRPDIPPLTPDGRSVADMVGTWHVARLRNSLVKRYALDLLRLSRETDGAVGFLLPLLTYTVRHNRERRTHHVPLFAGMLFVCQADPFMDVDPLRRTYAAGRPVPPLRTTEAGQKRLRDDLVKVEAFALADAARMNPFPFAKVGAPVRVANGPLRGTSGEVIYADGERRKFVILIECLGQKVSYELEPDIELEPI